MDQHPRDLLARNGLRPRHRLGQNFLVSGATLDRIVDSSALSPEDVVLEIGTGLGRLTARLAAHAGHVVTVEVDRELASVAAKHLGDIANVTVVCCDFLQGKHAIDPTVTDAVRARLPADGAPLRVVSNLPYCISSPAIVNLLEWDVPVGEVFVMVQKEVADRLDAQPGTKDYGPLTVCVNYWARVERLFAVPRQAFWPQPEVASSFVHIARRADRERTDAYAAFAATVRRLFTTRRKTLGSTLRSGWGPEAARGLVDGLGLAPEIRAETLSPEQIERLVEIIGPPRK
jgi:16S rRNA (adenine1518-N6/adenine1519-N6)-dimethyltransferase